ncbi:MAG: HlyD family efflux transporter periplasmic adaptor subunit [Gammaproteobacteria bacterium]|nr:HlyD family efflux transporter periplasmic adaptor subunit [Gammaproteobacteria bacterium]
MTATTKRIVLWTIIVAFLAIGIIYALLPRPVPVDLIEVVQGPMTVTVDEEGKTRIHDVFVLSAPVGGRVQRITAHVGDAVVAGETVLARIEPGDPSLLDPRSEAQAKAAVLAAESARTLAAAQVEQASAELDFAEAELRRANKLVVDGTISRRDYDEAERAHKTSRAALATARAELQVRLFELEQARAQLLSPTQTQEPTAECDCVPITAPVSGRVLTIVNRSERVVATGEALLEIGDPGNLEIVVDFLSADAVRINPGQRVIIDSFGGNEALAGRVRRVEPFGFTKISALGIEEQRVNVIIDLEGEPQQWSRLGHGYQVEARVVLWESNTALTVPLTALFRADRDWALFRELDGRAQLIVVELGQRNGIDAEIIAGLDEGDRVVPHPSDRVMDGVRISARGAR